MRVTNIMMTTNMLGNITRNKTDMNTKFNQYATGQKIQKPSEDPVVAIRSLKYRANLTELKQYLDKNVQDAFEWMNITESALDNMNELMTKMYSYCTQGAQDTYETIDRDSIAQTLQQYKEEIYECLNADYAGRYVFSGYRTDTTVCYEDKTINTEFEIKEPLTFQNLYKRDYVFGGARYQEGTTTESYKQMAPTTDSAYLLDLSYTDIKTMTGLTYVNADGEEVNLMESFDFREIDSTETIGEDGGVTASVYSVGSNEIVFIRDTGELVLSPEAYEALRTSKSITANYVKNTFNKGDLRPEMYFDCVGYSMTLDEESGEMVRRTDEDGNEEGISYTKPREQDICYEVNFSQNLKVNTMANETLNGTFARVFDNIMAAVNDAYNTQQEIDNVDLLLARTDNTDDVTEALGALREQLETELTLKKSMLQKAFSNGMAGVKEAQDGTKAANDDGSVSKISVSIATTSLGSRYTRLELIENRLTEQETSFTEILTNNESVNIEDAIINYNAAENTYNASLSAASKVVQNSLLNFL
ncbi:MAG: flagellar hook-associated protein FlgL [Lachnospiraceae bacterium]|nr:flagellar hook-associated protein FlgL [Lachnospiraceae bacterium]